MPLLCLKCDARIEPSIAKPGIFWCPGCEKEITRDNTYKVGKRFFASGVGAMLAMVAAMSLPGRHAPDRITRAEATNTFMEMKRQRRKKIHGLKKKQQRHTGQMRGR